MDQMEKILLVTGEVSGDHHAAALIKELKKLKPGLQITGIGGDMLENEGMQLLFHVKDMAFLGVGEVIRHLPFIRKAHNTLIDRAERERPVCAILIDYPGFNLKIAKSLKKLGIPVIYYISPQLWAWGKGRIDKIRKYVDRMVVLFPFEQKFYEQYQIDAEYVGHPLVDKHSAYIPNEFKTIDADNIVLGLLPGSRRQEVASLLPKMIETARILYKNNQIKTAEIVKVKHLPKQMYADHLVETDTFIKIIKEPIEKCLQRFDAVIVASGTATLETAYYGVPMLIVYHVNPITYWLGRMLVKIDYIGLANIVAESQVAVELIQNDFTPEKAAEHVAQMLDQEQNSQIRKNLKVVREKLGEPGASKRAAEVVAHFLDNNHP